MLHELDRIAVGVGGPGGAEATGEEVVWGAERGGAVGGEPRVVAIDVIGPEHDLDRPPAEMRLEPVVCDRCLDRGDAELEVVEAELDVDRPLLWGPERLLKAKPFVELGELPDVAGVEVDHRVLECAHAALRRPLVCAAASTLSKAASTASAAPGRSSTMRIASAWLA